MEFAVWTTAATAVPLKLLASWLPTNASYEADPFFGSATNIKGRLDGVGSAKGIWNYSEFAGSSLAASLTPGSSPSFPFEPFLQLGP